VNAQPPSAAGGLIFFGQGDAGFIHSSEMDVLSPAPAGFIRHCDGAGGILPVGDLQMDDKDRLLLGLLRRDARRPVVALARDLGLSRTATQDRLAKLQASGTITRFTIVGGDEQARERAYLMVRLEKGARCAQIVPKVRAIAEVEAIHSVTGVIDMIVCVASEHVDGIERARVELAGLAGVAEVSTHVVLERFVG